jgi:hypothetical protein
MEGWLDGRAIHLEPGMPVAGVLMDGDFSMSGVGTVTWKDGDRILGFGHPFFGSGDVEIPMAPARVITVVRTLQQSFKMSEVGPVIGSIYQDRLTGIAGEIGRKAPTIDVTYDVENGQGQRTAYRAQVFEHNRMSALLSAIGLLQSLRSNLDAHEEQTLFITTDIQVKGQAPIRYENVALNQAGATQLALQLLTVLSALTDNPFETPRIESIRCEVKMVPKPYLSFFDEVTITSSVPGPGESLDVNIRVRNLLGELEQHQLSIPIPVGTKGQVLILQIADASQVEPENRQLIRADMNSLADIVRQINQQRSQQNLHVRLLRSAEGLQLQGDSLYDLPPSVMHLFTTPKNAQYSQSLPEISLWQTKLPTRGVFSGSYRLNVEIK